LKRLIIFLIVLAVSASVAFAAAKLPKWYDLPETTTPAPQSDIYEYIDLAVLAAAMALAAYLALKRRSRRGLLALTIFSLLYFGFWRGGCVCPVGAIQNVTLGLFDSGYVVPATVIGFFTLPLVFALFFGRVFCAAVCPLGAIQDVVLVKPLKVPAWLAHALGILPYVYLGLAVLMAATGSAFIICRLDPFVAFFRLVPLSKLEIGNWKLEISGGRFNLLVLGACVLLISAFIGRVYCRFVCPYGALLRIMSRFSRWRVTITPDECIQCRLCEDACPFGAINKPTHRKNVSRSEGKGRLAALILLLPVMLVLGGWLGGRVSPVLSRRNPTIRLAQRIRDENAGKVKGTSDAAEVFRESRRPVAELYEEASGIRQDFLLGGRLLGAFIALVVMLKMIRFSIRRRRDDYEADRADCLACGRCFAYCPREQARLKRNREDK
jgi:polyferredoxin